VRASANFFEIGGHSLLATQVISRMRGAFGVEIGVGSIFEEPTVAGLARRVEAMMRAGERDDTPPLVRGPRGGALPLSFAQQRLWFLDQLVPNDPFYNLPGAVRLRGRLDLKALERAIDEIVRRHEVLRTRIEAAEGEPRQVVEAWEPRRLEVVDLSQWTPEESEEEVRRLAQQEAKTGFDLACGPLLRTKALKIEEERHVLLFTMHHIVSDGWSMGILIREVGALYRAYLAGEESPLTELPVQYADFAVWQRTWLQGQVLENQLAYWKRQLGALPVLELPTDKPRPVGETRHGGSHSLLLPAALSASLKALSLERNCTLFMTLLGAFKVLLSYLSGQTDIAVGTDIANRNRAETEGLIGFFVNQLVLRSDLPRDLTFDAWLKKMREITLEAYAHQDMPFEKLVETFNPNRDVSQTPLFQVKMVLQNAPAEKLSLPGLTLSPINSPIGATKFDLLLNLVDGERGLSASLQYNADIFEERTPVRILDRFQTLLDRIVERPAAKLEELIESMIEEDRREQFERDRALDDQRLQKLKDIKNIKRRAMGETDTVGEISNS